MNIENILNNEVKIDLPKREVYDKVKKRWDNAAKPLDSLGIFESVVCKIGAILETDNVDVTKKIIIPFCADNGIVAEGISQSGQEVTLAVAKAMGQRKSSVCKMAAVGNVEVLPIDIGINSDEEIEGVLNKKVVKGTANFLEKPAMTKEQVIQAMQTGFDMALDCKNKGYSIIGTGEMGIGNTTTSSAIAAALLRCNADDITGRGAGLSDKGLARKKQVINEAIAKYDLYNADPLTVLMTVGGLDIAGLTGLMIGCAYAKLPVLLDGVITAVAALLAVRMIPEVKEYLIGSHIGREPAIAKIYDELGVVAVIKGDLALGEGTGAAMFCGLLDMAMTLYTEQITFDDINIDAYERFN